MDMFPTKWRANEQLGGGWAPHVQRTYKTNCLLDELVDRVACQAVGPRAIGGDFNHEEASLSQLDRLRALGFQEVQSLAFNRWGIQPTPTGKANTIIDQLWISPELQAMFSSVNVVRDHWSDHASVVANFDYTTGPLYQLHWRMPKPFPWPQQWTCNIKVDWANPSEAYASAWAQLESQAVPTEVRFHFQQEGGALLLTLNPDIPEMCHASWVGKMKSSPRSTGLPLNMCNGFVSFVVYKLCNGC